MPQSMHPCLHELVDGYLQDGVVAAAERTAGATRAAYEWVSSSTPSIPGSGERPIGGLRLCVKPPGGEERRGRKGGGGRT